MPKQQLIFELNLAPANTLGAFHRAASQLGWQIVSYNNSELVCQEVIANPASSGIWPVKVAIAVAEIDSNVSRITLNGSNWGLGPFQSNHLKQQLETLIGMVSSQSGISPSQPTKIERSFWEQLGKPINKIGGVYWQNKQLVEELLNLPRDQRLIVLKQKVREMDDRTFQGFYWSLMGMYSLQIARSSNLTSAKSSKSWGNSFESQVAQSMAEAQYGNPSIQQKWEAQQAKNKAEEIMRLAGDAKGLRQ